MDQNIENKTPERTSERQIENTADGIKPLSDLVIGLTKAKQLGPKGIELFKKTSFPDKV